MKYISITQAKKHFQSIISQIEKRQEDYCICINGKPTIKMELINSNSRKNLFGCAKGMFEIPDDFDDIDLGFDFDN